MAFVKLDCGILNSTLWDDRDAREVFITALLMAVPHELTEPAKQIAVKSLDYTGWNVPPGWYGFVHAAGVGIVRQSGIEKDAGLDALERLGTPEPDSRTPDFDGRRLVRVDGGFIVLNFIRYRERDHTAAERSKRYRERRASRVATVTSRVASRSVTQAEAEAEADTKAKRKMVEPSTAAAISVRRRLPVSAVRAFDGIVRASQNPHAVAAEIGAILDGLHGPPASPEAVGQALRDLVIGGGRVTGTSLRGFVARSMRERQESKPGDGWDALIQKYEREERTRATQ